MPRIPHVGTFDWSFPDTTKGGMLGGSDHLCLLFHLDLDNGEPSNSTTGESTGYLNGRNMNPSRCNCVNPVAAAETRSMPEIAKNIGLIISMQDWSCGVIVSCMTGCGGQIFYLVASPFSKKDPIKYPTKFIESLVRQITKGLKRKDV